MDNINDDENDAIKIKMTNSDNYLLVSASDFPYVTEFIWYQGKDGYPVTYSSVDKKIKFGRGQKLHRMLEPNTPSHMVVDHINRNKLDNRRSNLRICTQEENSYNRSKTSSTTKSAYKGVKKTGNTWSANVTKGGVVHTIKNLPDEITAAKTYDIMVEELFGAFGAKNF